VTVAFKVVPSSTEQSDQVYLTGNHHALGDWDPADVPLEQQDDGSWVKTFEFKQGTHLEFKVTLGTWEREALTESGARPPNSVLDVVRDTTLVIHVPAWSEPEVIDITFRVVPEMIGETDQVFLTGNHYLLGLWDPTAIPLEKQADGSWQKTLSFYEGTELEYKITLGSWEHQALTDDGSVPPNSYLLVTNDTTITIPVPGWK
jgi:hypothetical protein